MKSVERHLYIRKAYYYYRSVIPRSLHTILEFKELVIALNTQDLSIARMQAVQINYEFTQHIRKLQKELITLSPEQSPERFLHDFLFEIQKIKNAYGYEPPAKYDHLKIRGKQGGEIFSSIVKSYIADCPADAHSTREHKDSTYNLFREVVGDLAFRNIGVEEARLFKSRLLKMPANAKRVWKVNNFENIQWEKIQTDNPQHPRTINNRLSYMAVLFNWAISAGYYHDKNPFTGLFIPKSQKVTASRTHPFKMEELRILFQSGMSKEDYNSSLYWVPLIGAYSGMRLNEICQLYVSDIREEDGVYIFDVNDDGEDKALKTSSSRRKIPIHKELMDKGLLEYVSHIRACKYQRLFPDIPMGKCAKNYSSTFTKRFWRHLKALDIKRDGLCFHSLRHTFIDGLRNAGVERSIVMTLTGHQSSKGVHDSYGYGYNLKVLQEQINKLIFIIDF